MKLGHLETRKLVLKTLAPVFIGSGREINKKEYVYSPNGHKVLIPELYKMYDYLEGKKLAARYEEFLLNGREDLLGFLRSNKVSDGEINTFTSYEIDAGDAVIDERTRKGILLFIKDRQNRPFIPGSSMKGALRTILLAYYLKKSPGRETQANRIIEASRREDMSRNRFLRDEAQRLEAGIFNTLGLKINKPEDAVNDFLKAVSISDSAPLALNTMALCTKKDFSSQGNEKTIPLYRECIKPGIELDFTMTLDRSVAAKAGFDWDDFGDALNTFNEVYEDSFMSRFKLPPQSEITPCKTGRIIYLGGGAGFISKTVVYPLMGRKPGLEYTSRLLNARFPKEHNHKEDPVLGVSPHMCKFTQYGGKLYPMGRCELVIGN